MAQAEFSGNQRAFQPRNIGIGAGSGTAQYQQGVSSDAARAKGFAEGMKPLGDYERSVANANLEYQTGSAAEQAGIRDLLLMQRGFNQDADISLRTVKQRADLDMSKVRQDADMRERKRKADNRAAAMQRFSDAAGIVAKFVVS